MSRRTTTCIVGLEHNGHVYIGGDTAGVNSSSLSIHSRLDEKVFRNEEFVMGFTTSFRMGQILRYGFSPPDHSSKKDDMAYLVTDFVDAVRAAFKERGFGKKEGGDEGEEGGIFLLGYRGRLYIIEEDFQVAKTSDGFAAVGCGQDLALGSLYTTRNSPDHMLRLKQALDAAAHFSAGVRSPYRYMSTESEEYIQYE